MCKHCAHPLNSGTLLTHSDRKPFLAPEASETLPCVTKGHSKYLFLSEAGETCKMKAAAIYQTHSNCQIIEHLFCTLVGAWLTPFCSTLEQTQGAKKHVLLC